MNKIVLQFFSYLMQTPLGFYLDLKKDIYYHLIASEIISSHIMCY